jgi:signal transduction histidine kinase
MFEDPSAVWRFTPQAWLPLSGFFLTLGLGLYIWSRNRSALLNRSFALLNVAAALWNLDVFLLFTVQDAELAGSLDRMLQIPIVSIPFLGLFFFFSFLGIPRRHPLLVAFGLWTVMLWFISTGPGFIASWDRHWFGYYGRAGRFYPLFIATHVAYLLISCRFLWKAHRASGDGLRRHQIANLLLANLVLCLISLHNFGPLYGAQRLPLGNLAAVLYFFVISATIVRYRLLDAHVFFRYSLIYSTLTFVLSGLYLLLILGLQGWFQVEFSSGSLLLPMMPAMAVAFAFGPVKSSLQERLDRYFFRSRKLLRSRLAGFAAVVAPLEREEEVWRAAWDRGWKYVDPAWVSIVSERNGCSRPEVTAGDVPDAGTRGTGAEDRPGGLRLQMEGTEGPLGSCLLGPKRGGDVYSTEETSYVRAIAAQSALAVEKVRLIEEGRRKERLAAFGRAAAVISHELRNPLNVIRAAAALLRSRVAGGDGEELVGVVEGEIRRGDRFISDFLAACREPRPSCCTVELGPFLRRFARTWPEGEFASMTVKLSLPPSCPTVRADPFQLERVFQNLARNSAEVTGGSGTVTIRCEPEGASKVLITVADDGPGIAADSLPRLFEPFQTSKSGGTGLGLSIVRTIVEAHGGRITGKNGEAGGAVFRIALPALIGKEGT